MRHVDQRGKQDHRASQLENLSASVPLMTLEAFAQASGLSVGTLRAQVSRGYWATKKVGRKVMIDIVALRLEAVQRYQER